MSRDTKYIKAGRYTLQLPDEKSIVLATTIHSVLALVECVERTHSQKRKYDVVAKIFGNAGQGEMEYDIGTMLDNKHVLIPIASCRSPNRYIIFYPYCDGGSVEDLVQKPVQLTEQICRTVFKQMVEALIYLHSINIVHNDVKPENFLIERDTIKICDYGLSRTLEQNTYDPNFVGTPNFMAPEVLMRASHTFSADVWSLGVCLYYMYYKRVPYTAVTERELKNAIFHESSIDFNSRSVSSDFKDLIQKILVMKPGDRLTLEAIMKHPWINPPMVQSARSRKLGASGFHHKRSSSAPPKL